jgi:PQQ-like domain
MGRIFSLLLVMWLNWPLHAAAQTAILTHHGGFDRGGNFVVPGLTFERAREVRLDRAFHAEVAGRVYAQPLYWRGHGTTSGTVLVATEENRVYALDALSGNEVWQRKVGEPVARSALGCGNIDPLGITGTPVIDDAAEALYLDAMVGGAGWPRHRIFSLSLKDGAVVPGWPLDVTQAFESLHQSFNARDQNQRGALTILGETLYVPFGGHFGDCGQYRGSVLGVSLKDPKKLAVWATRGRGGGIWAPGGLSSDGKSLFAATGNTLGVTTWSDGEAVFRLAPDLHRSADKQDFFAPPYWRELDETDADLGSTAPIPLDLPAQFGTQAVILALGKDRHAYLLDRNNLGGIGGSLAAEIVARNAIRTAPAAYPAADGVLIAFQGAGARCPRAGSENGLTVLKVRAGTPPRLETAWCGELRGAGAPIVTTTDGRTDPIVWIVGAEGDNRLHAFRGDTGEPLFAGGPPDAVAGVRRFQSLIAAERRLYIAADGRLVAFGF